MSDDRRTARRIRLPGVQVTYEDAAGERYQARAADLSREGLYIPSSRPIAVGKRLSLEIQPVGDTTAWSALGRVVWIREADEGDDRPAGMAVKIIDADDSVLDAIQQLLEAREPTERGLGTGDAILPVRPKQRSNPPSREKTMLGVGLSPAPAAPILITAPGREPTLLGVGRDRASAEPREPSLAIDLVTKKPPSVRPATELVEALPASPLEVPTPIVAVIPSHLAALASGADDHPPVTAGARAESERPHAPSARPMASPREESVAEREPSEPLPLKKGSAGRWIFLLIVLGGVAGGAYVFRDRLPAYWQTVVTTVNKQLR